MGKADGSVVIHIGGQLGVAQLAEIGNVARNGGLRVMVQHTGLDFWCYALLGATVLLVVGLHQPEGAALSA
ncbi:hypothetical protein [uncultured Roseobacter sp.]|uniref:hypothetical protein n=1 Tax=uncultured Roseobacter sp. TaxID=114847 RepID=UPI0026056532|nr:hypothetical protein [uncultured Roseobacter sp.]